MTRRFSLTLAIFIFLSLSLLSKDCLATQWARTYGGSDYDFASSIKQTTDGGFIVVGYTESFGSGLWVLKTDRNGNISWQKIYGGGYSGYQHASIQQTTDSGYIVAGAGWGLDVCVIKLDQTGNISWQKTYGGSENDEAFSIQQTTDGGFIVAGYTFSFGTGYNDMWILKLDQTGNISWQKTYGGSDYDDAYSIQQTADGGFIVAGRTHSFGAGGWDMLVLKLDQTGNVSWQKTYGGNGDEAAYSIRQSTDGGFIVSGESSSLGTFCMWILKLDQTGNVTMAENLQLFYT